MSTGGADWRGFRPGTTEGAHWEIATINGDPWMLLVEVATNYHWGNKNLDEDVAVIGRSDIVAVRSAAATSQAAFDAAMANTPAASSYAAMLTAATSAGVSGAQFPGNVARRWWLNCAADYPLT